MIEEEESPYYTSKMINMNEFNWQIYKNVRH